MKYMEIIPLVMMTGTGGKYVHASNADELLGVFEEVSGDITDFNKDTDGDMINDYYEKKLNAGILTVGDGTKLVGMDYKKADTDGDTLKDGEELVVVKTNRLMSDGSYEATVHVKMESNPLKADSDGDGISDNEDPHKLTKHSFDVLNEYILRSECGAKEIDKEHEEYEEVPNPNEYYYSIVVHHTTRNQYEEMAALEKSQLREFSGIGYHFAIDGNGTEYPRKVDAK